MTQVIETQPEMSILIASTNQKTLIELCLKSIFAHTDIPVKIMVLDSSNNYREIPLLERLHAKGKISLFKYNTLWKHDRALNELLSQVSTPYFITLDSDVEICKKGWVEKMLQTAKDRDAAIVYAKQDYVADEYVDEVWCRPVGNSKYSVHFALYRTSAIKALSTHFEFRKLERQMIENRVIEEFYDTGQYIYHSLRERSIELRQLKEYHVHYGSMSVFTQKIGAYKLYFSRNFKARRKRRCRILKIWLRNYFRYGKAQDQEFVLANQALFSLSRRARNFLPKSIYGFSIR